MSAPSYPVIPPGYTPSRSGSRTLIVALQSSQRLLPNSIKAALYYVLSTHANEVLDQNTVGDLMKVIEEIKLDKVFGFGVLPLSTSGIYLNATVEDNEQLKLEIQFDPTIISTVELEWLLSHLLTVLPTFLYSPDDTPLDAILLVSAEEVTTLHRIAHSNDPKNYIDSYPNCSTLPHFFLSTAQELPDTIALQFDELSISYSQLLHLSQFLAYRIGGQRGTVVPICIDKSIEMIVAMIAVTLSGSAYLNLEPKFPAARKEGILRELKEKGLLNTTAVVQELEVEVWKAWECLENVLDPSAILKPLIESLSENPATDLSVEFSIPLTSLPVPVPSDPAYLIFTSGSSGAPKGIIIDHRNVAAFIKNYRGVFGRAIGERILQFPSYSFDVSVMNIWDTFAHGATLCMTTPTSLLSDLAGTIIRLGCTVVDLTPTISTLLFENIESQPLKGETIKDGWIRAGFKIKMLCTGGEKVERWVRDAWLERGVKVVIDYGPSETTVGVISNQKTSLDSAIVPIGRPTGLTKIYILSPSLKLTPLGCIGEICVSGDQVSRGYVKEDLNKDVFVEHETLGRIYRTGDLGKYLADEDYSLDCLGRRDGQVKVNGLRIEVGEIEQHLNTLAHPDLIKGVVDKLETDKISTGLVAYLEFASPSIFFTAVDSSVNSITSTSEFQGAVKMISARLAKTLPAYMIPRYWICIKIPTAGMGKTDRKLLRLLAEEHNFRQSSKKSVQTDDEPHRIVRRAWAKVLKLGEVELDDRDEFTRLGGDSIGFMKVISLLRVAGFKITFADLVTASTLSDCAAVASKASKDIIGTAQATKPFSLVASTRLPRILKELEQDYSISAESIEDLFATSPTQDSLIAASIDSSHYYAQAVYNLDPSTTTTSFIAAIQALVHRHAVLRTVFVLLDESIETIQVVLKPQSQQVMDAVTVTVREVQSSAEMTAAVKNWLEVDRTKNVFAWGRLLLSFALFTSPTGDRKLIWSMHHAMSDGFTLELLTTDLHHFTHSLSLPDRPTYSNVVSFWSNLQSSISVNNFWKSYLSNSSPLSWPSTAPLLGAPLSTSTIATKHWNGDLTAASRRIGVTPAVMSRTAIQIALGHHSKKKDIAVGIVRSGRDIDVNFCDTIIGPLVSVLPSRVILEPSTSLLDLLQQETSNDLLSRLNQTVTLSDLAKICQLTSRADIFDILVTYQSLAEREKEETLPYPIRQPPTEIYMPTSYTLSMEITPSAEDPDFLELGCFFDNRVIESEEVNQLLKTIARVLDYIVVAPCTTIDKMELGSVSPIILGIPVPIPQQKKLVDGTKMGGLIERLSKVWGAVLRLDGDSIGPDESFTALGGDSIGVMRLSVRLTKERIPIPVHSLSKLPTLIDQANYLLERN